MVGRGVGGRVGGEVGGGLRGQHGGKSVDLLWVVVLRVKGNNFCTRESTRAMRKTKGR